MDNIDLKLKLFGGRPIHAQGYGDITPLKIRDIIDIGYTEYIKYLNILTLDVEDFLEKAPEEEVSVLDLLLSFGGEELEQILEESLAFFLGGEIVIDKDNLRVFVKRNEDNIVIIDNKNYSAIQEVVKWQNYINSFDEKNIDNFKPADDETRKLKEEMDALAKKRDELKKKQSGNAEDEEQDDMDFFDILSAISSKSYGVNELNVLDLTIYQVYRKFKRLEVIEQYDISIKSILAGAKDVKLRHWSSKA